MFLAVESECLGAAVFWQRTRKNQGLSFRVSQSLSRTWELTLCKVSSDFSREQSRVGSLDLVERERVVVRGDGHVAAIHDAGARHERVEVPAAVINTCQCKDMYIRRTRDSTHQGIEYPRFLAIRREPCRIAFGPKRAPGRYETEVWVGETSSSATWPRCVHRARSVRQMASQE